MADLSTPLDKLLAGAEAAASLAKDLLTPSPTCSSSCRAATSTRRPRPTVSTLREGEYTVLGGAGEGATTRPMRRSAAG